jgi:PD-(D/E)XK endonuclease
MNTSKIGEISQAQVLAALVQAGKSILLPFGDNKRYDLLIEEEDGRFFRVQCKTGRIINGAMQFPTSSLHAASRTGLDKSIKRSYRGVVDFFGVYCPQNGKVYLIPIDHLGDNGAFLRVEPPRNNQRRLIRWAHDYEIGAVAQLGARVNGIHEVTGSIPVGSTSSQTELWD